MSKDEQPPAPVIAADFRPGLMDSTKGHVSERVKTEKRTSVRELLENPCFLKKIPFVGINTDD